MDIEIKDELKKITSGLHSLVNSLDKVEALLLEAYEPDAEDIEEHPELRYISIKLAEKNKLSEAKEMLIKKHNMGTLLETDASNYKIIKADLLALLAEEKP